MARITYAPGTFADLDADTLAAIAEGKSLPIFHDEPLTFRSTKAEPMMRRVSLQGGKLFASFFGKRRGLRVVLKTRHWEHDGSTTTRALLWFA